MIILTSKPHLLWCIRLVGLQCNMPVPMAPATVGCTLHISLRKYNYNKSDMCVHGVCVCVCVCMCVRQQPAMQWLSVGLVIARFQIRCPVMPSTDLKFTWVVWRWPGFPGRCDHSLVAEAFCFCVVVPYIYTTDIGSENWITMLLYNEYMTITNPS